MTLSYLGDELDIDYTLSFLIEWNHPYREIENLEMKVQINYQENSVKRKCYVTPSTKRGKSLYDLNELDGFKISHSDLFQEHSIGNIVDIFVDKKPFSFEGKQFRVFKEWLFDDNIPLPPFLRLVKVSNYETRLCYSERVEINLNVKKLKMNNEKMDYHLESYLGPYFHQRSNFFYLMPLKFWIIDEKESDVFILYLSHILNKLVSLPIYAMMKRNHYINIFQNQPNKIQELLMDKKLLKDLSAFIKQFVFFEHDNFSSECVFILNFLNDKLQNFVQQ